MNSHTAAVIAAGSQGRVHAAGYRAAPGVRLVAVADSNLAAARELADDLDIPSVYADYRELLETERPHIISVCTPPALHLDIVRVAVASGVKAIHCEKPIALSYGDAFEMDRITREAGVQLTFNLQRRFEPVHRFGREQIVAGVIGDVVSVEGYCPNLPDWGTHIFDLVLFYLGDAPPSWVMGQIDVSVNRYVYNAFAETSSITLVKWESGINATVFTGREPQTPILNLSNNTGLIIQGTLGRLEARGSRCEIFRFGEETIRFDTPFSTDVSTWDREVDPAIVACTAEAILDLVQSLDAGTEPVLSSRHGLVGAELIFATYESSRSRSRVTLPLERHDNALLAGLEQGFWSPVGEQRSTY
jgi:UDP-N-acetylglucosamine 3-dehydrogenase